MHKILEDSLGAIDETHQPQPGSIICDMYVMKVTLNIEKVHEHAEEIIEILKQWPTTSQGQVIQPLGEPAASLSYIMAGVVLEDQQKALQLFAFGKLLNWWDVMDPYTVLGCKPDHPMGVQLASIGMVAISGYHPNNVT